jgi:Asp/Glu/hydantoin racemase
MAKNSPEVSPAQIRSDKKMLEKLVILASKEIQENNIDSFTLGCGSFIDIAKKLQNILRKEFGPSIHVVDPVAITFDFVKNQLASKKSR